jgi:hypothetical protein
MELNLKHTGNFHVKGIFLFFLIAHILILNGCKVSYSFTGANPSLAKTFNVVYFQNRAPLVQPGLAQYITDALIDKCKTQTSLKYVTGTGDVSFEGEVSDYNTRPLTVAADAQAAMNRFTITIKVKFTNSIEPDYSFEQAFSRYEDYNSNFDLSAVEKDLGEKIIEMIVEDVFNKAFVNW